MKISIIMEALTGRFETDTDRATKNFNRRMKRLERDATRAAKRSALAITGLAATLTVAAKKSINYADSIGKTADKLGVGVEALQELRFAAKQSGIEQNTLDMALQRFTRRSAEAAAGTGEAKTALAELGIQLTDNQGRLRSTEDLLRDVADALQDGYSPAEQLRIAFKLFDSEGAALVNMLRGGSKGLDDFAKQANDAGLVLEERLIRDAEEAANKMDQFQQAMQVSIARVVTENADSIIELANSLIQFVGVIGKAVSGWNDWLAAQGVGVDTIDEIRERGNALLREKTNLEQRLAKGGVALANGIDGRQRIISYLFGDEDELRSDIQKRIDEINQEMMRLQDQAVGLGKKETDPKKKGADGPAYNPIIPPEEVDKDAKRIASIITDLEKQVRAFGKDEYDSALITLVDLGASEEQIASARLIIDELRSLDESEAARTAQAERRAELESEYASLISNTLTDVEQHAALIERINEMYAAGVIPNAQAYGDIVGRVNEDFLEGGTEEKLTEMDQFATQAARNIQSQFADFLFNPFEEGLDGMLEGFARTVQRMIAEAAAAQILKSLFGSFGDGSGDASGGLASVIGGIFGGARATGGPVAAGVPYLVGERGPELIVPQSAGNVIPNDKLGGKTIVNNFHFKKDPRRKSLNQEAVEINRLQRKAESRNR